MKLITTIIFKKAKFSYLVSTILILLISLNVTAQTETLNTGAYIINMGVVPQTQSNALKPYGLIYDLLKNYNVQVKWVINQAKVKDGADFTYNSVQYKGGTFIIPAEYRTAAVNSRISFFGVTGTTTTTSLTVNVTYTLNTAPKWTLDFQNGNIAAGFFADAGIPSSAYDTKTPAQLNGCDEIYVMPHADADWAYYGPLRNWILNNRGSFWGGCRTGSQIENLFNPANTSEQMNFLSNNVGAAGNALIPYGSHADGTPPYTHQFPTSPVAQYMGITDAAHQSGSEEIYLPKLNGSWRATTQVITFDPTQSNVPALSPGPASTIVFGRAFGNPSSGLVMYESGHDIGGTAVQEIAAQRAFWNFSFLSSTEVLAGGCVGNIGDFVWSDNNGNGIQDAGENGIQGVTVTLTKPDLSTVTTTTSATGFYQFGNLAAGTYKVTFPTTLAGGYVLTNQNIGLDDSKDSDPDLGTGLVNNIVIAPGQNNPTIDAGYSSNCLVGGLNLGRLTENLFVFTNGSTDANWQSASKGFIGNVAIDGLQASENTSGSFAYAGTISTNAASLGAWQSIVDNNAGQASSSLNQTTLISSLETDLNNVFTQVNALPVTAGYDGIAPTALNGLNTTNGVAQTFVININSSFDVSSQINITGDAGDIFILRWDTDKNFSNGYQGQVKFQSGGAIIPLGGLKPSNFIHVAGDINSSGGGSNPPLPYPQGPRTNNGTGSLITGGADFSGGGFFTGYWFTTGDPVTGETAPLSNGIFVGGWYSTTNKFSMTSGTSGVYVTPVCGTPSTAASIGDFVWNDGNGNGLQDATEPGLSGVQVQLLNTAGTVIATTTTNGVGFYQFTGLVSGTYTVKFLPVPGFGLSPSNVGANDAIDSDVDGTGSVTVVLTAGQSNQTIDAGFYPATCNGRVTSLYFNELAGGVDLPITNGSTFTVAQLASLYNLEAGTSGTVGSVKFTITGPTATSNIENTTPYNSPGTGSGAWTGALGSYSVNIKTYNAADAGGTQCHDTTITFILTNTTFDCNCIGTNVVLNPGFESGITNWSFSGGTLAQGNGAVACGSFSGDLNNTSATSKAWQTIGTNLTTGTVVNVSVYAGTHDNSFNNFVGVEFLNSSSVVLGTSVYVQVDKILANAPTGPQLYTFTATVPTGTTTTRVVFGGTGSYTKTDRWCVTLTAPSAGSIGDFVWNDGNGNGIQDVGELGISNATVTLTFPNGSTATTTTNASGIYSFTNLAPGTYSVAFTTPAGFTPTANNVGANDAIDSDPIGGVVTGIVLSAGQVNNTIDAGFYATPVGGLGLGNQVFDDKNRSGLYDAGDGIVAGATVKLYLDANNDNVPDGAAISTTLTDATGNYSFINLAAGNYIVGVTIPAGFAMAVLNGGDPDNNINNDNNGLVLSNGEVRGNSITLSAGTEPDINTNNTYDIGIYNPALPPNGGEGCFTGTNPLVFAKSYWNVNANSQTVTMRVTFAKTFVDNTYGTNAIGWPNGHTFSNLTGSDHLQWSIKNGAGTEVLAFKQDYISASATFPSGYGNLGFGGDGGNPTAGLATDVLSFRSSLTSNFNDFGYILTTNSPLTDANYTPNPTYPNWINEVWYEITVKSSAFGATGFGFIDVASVHASPSKTGNNTEIVTNTPCPNLNLGNAVWYDQNNDGIKQATETGIVGATVKLYADANNDNVADGVAVATTTTGAGGVYGFANLAPSNYIVGVVIPTGYAVVTTNGGDPDNNTDNDNNGTNTSVAGEVRSSAVTLTTGGEPATAVDGDGTNGNLTVDFGLRGTASIGDFVFNDINANGIQDAGELGISNATVTLTFPNGSTATTTTNASGIYSFTNLAPGTYSVAFTTPAGFTPTASNVGANDAIDSDPIDGVVTGIVLTAGQVNNTIDAGFYQSNLNLGNAVWYDQNNDGIKQATETGIVGATVNLYADANNDNVADGAAIATTTTIAGGTYGFANLAPGNYIVGVIIPTGYAVVTTNGGDPDNDTDNDNNGTNTSVAGEVRSTAITLTTGGEPATAVDGDGTNGNLTVDFGLRGTASIGDFVFNDINANGIQDAGELGIANATVTLTYPNGSTAITTTNASGIYNFTNLAPGTYSVAFTAPAGFANASPDNQGVNDAVDSDPIGGVVTGIVLTAGQVNNTVDAGFYNCVPITSGINGPLTICAAEAALFTATGAGSGSVYTWTFMGGTPATATGSSATSTWSAVGEYDITLTVTKNGCTQSYTRSIVITQSVFAAAGPDADICSGSSITLNGTGPAGSNYSWTVVAGDPTSIDNGASQQNVLVSPLVTTTYLLTVTQNGCTRTDQVTVFINVNKNPIADAGPNRTTLIGTAVTIGGSPTGTAPLATPGAALGYIWSPVTGLNSNTLSNPTATLTVPGVYNYQVIVYSILTGCSDTSIMSVTAIQPVNLGNHVWYDKNNNGIKEVGEPGVATTVRLYKDDNNDNIADGAAIATTTTVNGVYNFGNLYPGNYIVGAVIPNGFLAVNTNGGDPDNNVDNDNNGINTTVAGEVRTSTITLSAGGEPAIGADGDDTNGNLTLDIALTGLAQLGNYVWEDVDRDGIQDDTEVGIPNVTVTITYPDGGTATSTTNAFGAYLFDKLMPGTYSVAFATPNGFIPTISNVTGGSATDANDSDPINGVVSNVILSAGQINNTIDAGFFRPINIYGNVWHDANALIDNQVNKTSLSPIPNALNVYLVDDATGIIVQAEGVLNDGTYSFLDVSINKSYRIVITSIVAGVGDAAPRAALPSGWRNTGENLGAGPNSGDDGVINGVLFIDTETSDIFNANFGIRIKNGEVIIG